MNKIIFVILAALGFYACETSEDISFGLDHEVPSYRVLTDSLQVQTGQTVEIKVEVSDNSGLSKVVFSYGDWLIRESISLADFNFPKNYTFQTAIIIPADAAKEWQEDVILNDGSKKTITQHYHKLLLQATDVNMNTRNIPVYIQVN
jgi:hypothetical protein